MRSPRRLPVALVLAVAAFTLRADDVTVGTSFKMRSEVLGEERTVLVHTPQGYDQGLRFPVLYMTDGETQFAHTATAVDFLARSGRISPLIVVAVTNNRGTRTRDLTPTSATFAGARDRTPVPGSGGADRFLKFFETELIPRIESTYRTLPFRVFAGHSFGGLFALHAFATRPGLFNGVIAVSPSLDWDDDLPIREVKTLLAARPELASTLFVTLGNEGEGIGKKLADLEKVLKKGGPKGFRAAVRRFPDDDHGSVVLKSHYEGLERVYDGWRLPRDPKTGAFAGDLTAVKAHYTALSKRFGYTVVPPEVVVNLIGYAELGAKRYERAFEAFRLNIQNYPESANVYDSLGEAQEASGDLPAARTSYAKAVEMAKGASDPLLNAFEQHVEAIDGKLKGVGTK